MNEFELIKKYLAPLSINNKGSFNLTDDIFFFSPSHSKKKCLITQLKNDNIFKTLILEKESYFYENSNNANIFFYSSKKFYKKN